ncbi:WAT1-related protein At1g25270-like isoform X3 [Prosopis cineraria]|uniref:WAT1-related protein At1g25270-like isoform X3 n=1 Tax=Prosopis cineraria TaxID=364024 RepID=UPI00240FA76F|nr:WAT1-related protein At1g25270-like isoform X3 [Prosopis cineraria]
MESLRNMLKGLKPAVLMVMVQVAYAGVNVLFKLAINDGMSMRIATAYRLLFASAFTLPLALLFERNKRPKLTRRLMFMEFLCGLFGLERLNLGTAGGKAKILGTIIGLSGAALLTFFKGFEVHIWPSQINLLHHDQNEIVSPADHSEKQRLLGVLCSILSCFSFAFWLIVQAHMGEDCPSYLSSAALMSIMGAIQATLFALCVDRDWDKWKLGWNVRLLTVSYAGIVTSGLVVMIIAWCVQMRGPLFTSVFQPLMLVVVAIAASLTLNEKLYLGSVLGSFLIVCGLYIVVWGKSQEMKMKTELVQSKEDSKQEDQPEPILEVVVFNKVHAGSS